MADDEWMPVRMSHRVHGGRAPNVAGPDLSLPHESWMDDGLCQQTDPEAFFPEKGGSTREAKRICLGCEVRPECLDFALARDERFGIWGGLSERERRKLKRDMRGGAA